MREITKFLVAGVRRDTAALTFTIYNLSREGSGLIEYSRRVEVSLNGSFVRAKIMAGADLPFWWVIDAYDFIAEYLIAHGWSMRTNPHLSPSPCDGGHVTKGWVRYAGEAPDAD